MTQATKRLNQGKIELDYDDVALIVHYEIETVYRDEYGKQIYNDNREENIKVDSKRIKLRNLAAEANLAQLAADIVVSMLPCYFEMLSCLLVVAAHVVAGLCAFKLSLSNMLAIYSGNSIAVVIWLTLFTYLIHLCRTNASIYTHRERRK
jgi:hypothetical protein